MRFGKNIKIYCQGKQIFGRSDRSIRLYYANAPFFRLKDGTKKRQSILGLTL